GGDARADAATGVDGNCEGGAEIRRVVGHLRRQVELVTTFFCKWETNQTTGMTGHEIDDLGSDLLGCADEIAFILSIFVVNDNDHPSVADLCDGFLDSRNRHDGMLTETTQPRKAAGAGYRGAGRQQGSVSAQALVSCSCTVLLPPNSRAWRGAVRRTSR